MLPLLIIAIVILAALSATYTLKAIPLLVHGSKGSGDLRQRWIDQYYTNRRQNPYDVFIRSGQYQDAKLPTVPQQRLRYAQSDPAIGPPASEGYPGWSFFSGYLFFSLPWQLERYFWAALSVASMFILAAWGWEQARSRGADLALAAFTALSITAVGTLGTSTSLGQYAAVLLAAIVLAEWCVRWGERYERHSFRRISAVCIGGVFLGISLAKPQFGAPFLVVYLVRRRLGILLATAGYIVLASTVIWWAVRTSPLEMTHQMLATSALYLTQAYGPPQMLAHLGIPIEKSMVVLGAAVPLVAIAVMMIWARTAVATLDAVAGVAGRLWTYHKLYDNPMVLFLLVALILQAMIEKRPSRAMVLWIAVFFAGLTLWPRPKFCDLVWYQIFQMLVWIAGTILLLAFTPRKRATQDSAQFVAQQAIA